MQLRLAAGTTLLALILAACSSSSAGDDATHESGGSSGTSTTSGSAGSTNGSAGTTSVAGKSTTGGNAGSTSASSAGHVNGAGGSAGKSAMDSGNGGMPAQGGMGAGRGGRANGTSGANDTCSGDMGCSGGPSASGGAGTGTSGNGMGGASNGGSAGGVNQLGGFAGAIACPGSGHVTYTLQKDASPTSDEQNAYDLITTAMDRATQYYDCYTNITKAEMVSYDPSVATADGNINGNIRFGQTDYMEYITAMHEISHSVGIGTDSHWPSLVVNGIFTGTHATDQLRAITGNATDQLNADTQHFWPYGLNYTSEVKSEADLVDHCMMVVAIRWDEGYSPN